MPLPRRVEIHIANCLDRRFSSSFDRFKVKSEDVLRQRKNEDAGTDEKHFNNSLDRFKVKPEDVLKQSKTEDAGTDEKSSLAGVKVKTEDVLSQTKNEDAGTVKKTVSNQHKNFKRVTAWSSEDMEQALQAIKNGTMNPALACKTFNIPTSTMYKRVRRGKLYEAYIENGGKQANRRLPLWSKETLSKALRAVVENGMCPAHAGKVNGIPKTTMYRHIKRDPELVKQEINLQPVRAKIDKTKLKKCRRTWRQQDMLNALKAVREDGFSVHKAAQMFNIPKSTLRRYDITGDIPPSDEAADACDISKKFKPQRVKKIPKPKETEKEVNVTEDGFVVDNDGNVKIYVDGMYNKNGTGIGVWFHYNNPHNEMEPLHVISRSISHCRILALRRAIQLAGNAGLKKINLCIDSSIIIKSFEEEWVGFWQINEWLRPNGQQIKNQCDMVALVREISTMEVVRWSLLPRRILSKGMNCADALSRISATLTHHPPKKKDFDEELQECVVDSKCEDCNKTKIVLPKVFIPENVYEI